jgi:hypothetical protein
VQNGRPESFDNATKWTSGVVIDLEKLVNYEVADAHSKALDMLRKAPTYNFARFLEGDKKREAEQFRQLLVTVRELMQSTPPPSG